MELLFLGTGAGELWPSLFCDCAACRRAVARGGRPRRIGACLLVDRTFLFDLPPNLPRAALDRGVGLADVRHLAVTHSHQDHLDPCVLAARGRQPSRPLDVYCNRRVRELLRVYQDFNRFFDPERLGVRFHVLAPGAAARCEADAFTVTALAADHDCTGGEEPLIFVLETRTGRLLYACDTGMIPEISWRTLAQFRYDAVVLDCTFHLQRECRRGHLGLAAFLEQKRRFEAEGLLKPTTRFIAQHVSLGHDAEHSTESTIAAALAEHGVIMARDGMRLVC